MTASFHILPSLSFIILLPVLPSLRHLQHINKINGSPWVQFKDDMIFLGIYRFRRKYVSWSEVDCLFIAFLEFKLY